MLRQWRYDKDKRSAAKESKMIEFDDEIFLSFVEYITALLRKEVVLS